MKGKRLTALLVSAIMILSLLAGCSGGTTGNTNTSGAAAAKEETAAAGGQTTAQAEQTEAADEEIPTITFYNNTSMAASSSGEGATDPKIYKELQDYILEHTGVRVEIISGLGADETKLSTLIAGNQIDAWWGDYAAYYKDGIIMPLNEWKDVIEELFGAENVANITAPDGTIWGTPRLAGGAPNPVFVRNDWLDQVGMDMPSTMEELNTYLYKIKELDPYGNGETIPLLANSVGGLENVFLGGYVDHGTDYWLDETDGKLKLPWMADGYTDFLAQVHQWYQDGMLHPEFLTFTELKPIIQQGRVGATACWYSNITGGDAVTRQNVGLDTSKYTYTFGWSKTGITGPNGNPIQTYNPPGRTCMMISSRCEHPEAIFKVLKWAMSPVEEKDAVEGMPEDDVYYRFLAYGPYGETWVYQENADGSVSPHVLDDGPTYLYDFAIGHGALKSDKPVPTYDDDGTLFMHSCFLTLSGSESDEGGTFYTTPTVTPEIKISTVITDADLSKTSALEDVNTYRTEEMAKFITGERSIDTYDQFIEECYNIGLDEIIDSYTAQYNEQHQN